MKEIQLSQGKVAIIDDEDFERVSQFKWHYNERYAKTRMGPSKVYLHRYLIHCPDGHVVDHKDGDTLNNRKENLRIASRPKTPGTDQGIRTLLQSTKA